MDYILLGKRIRDERLFDNYEQYLDLNIGVSTGNTSIGYATFVMDSTGTKGGQVEVL